jgi:glucosamine--fructose-6-phosphate aminotransferase (isomerizing)
MCGIIAVIRRATDRSPPLPPVVASRMDTAEQAARRVEKTPGSLGPGLAELASHLRAVDLALRGIPGLRCMLAEPSWVRELAERAERLDTWVHALERRIDAGSPAEFADSVEQLNAPLLAVKDAVWAIRRERIVHADAVADLLGGDDHAAAIEAFSSVEIALSALNRLEVRGRDSAGLHLLVSDHGLDLADPGVACLVADRRDPLFRTRAVATPSGHLSFVYKAAREVGELGDNTRLLRAAVRADPLLRAALANPDARAVVLGHTRWASVGLVSEANAHPINQLETGRDDFPYVVAAVNGDVDNYEDLAAEHELAIPPGITTDSKIIPVLTARRIPDAPSVPEAFRWVVDQLHGSVAIAADVADDPGRLYLALRGSGQTLCIGLTDDMYVVASEPYGVVEETSRYLRMDGEAISPADGAQGQIVVLDAAHAGTLAGIRRLTYGGEASPVEPDELCETEITTRDIDRGDHPHFLLKEISEAPGTMRKTLRGRTREVDGRLVVRLGTDTMPDALRDRLRAGSIHRVIVIGQGTASIAGTGVAAAIREALSTTEIAVVAQPASELSAFGLCDEMSDTLVIAVTQSGTTTDTNRTIDLARARGAAVLAIVNRRSSDITHKADGVLFTSDGRDIEMSVASTKAFYSQIAAGFLLAYALADAIGCSDRQHEHELLAALTSLPSAMEEVLASRAAIGRLAWKLAPRKRHWAIVGNGRNLIAASEIRIKMSELCYKSIALDVTEDKKHIDLSAEPLTLVCAAGLTGSAATDVAKEVAIFRAQKGEPVVIATTGSDAFSADEAVLYVPAVHRDVAYVLSTMVGHLFGYEAALAIDAQARPLRAARVAVEAAAGRATSAEEMLIALSTGLADQSALFREKLWSGMYNSTLEPMTTARLAAAFGYVEGSTALDLYDRDFGRVGSPDNVVDDLTAILTLAIDELARPIDTIRHQAKTVTVGISRSDESLYTIGLVTRVLQAGAAREHLSYGNLRTLATLDGAVAEVTGFTRYRIDKRPASTDVMVTVIDQGGVSNELRSRVKRDDRLRGTKRLVADERLVLVARGRSDGRLVIFVPEVNGGVTTELTLLHVRFHDRVAAARMRRVLDGYRRRLAALSSAVTETESAFDESRLGELPVWMLLTESIDNLADLWRDGSHSVLLDTAELAAGGYNPAQ